MWCVTVILHTAQRGCPRSGQTYCNSLCTICSNCTCETVCSVLLCKMQRSCSIHQVSSSCMSILHVGMSSGPGSTQTHGLAGDTFTSPEYSTDSEDSQSHTSSETKLSSEELEEESKHQGSRVSNASPFTHKSLVPTHHDVTCASFSPTMQVPSEPAEGESDPHEVPEPAAVKGECRVAVCLSMLVPTTNMRRGDADMLHHSLPTLTTANVSLVCLYLCINHTVCDTENLTFLQASQLFCCWHTQMSQRKVTVILYYSTRV